MQEYQIFLINVMIVFQFHYNFDSVEEILKIRFRFIFEWRKLLFRRKYMWQWSLSSTILQLFQFEPEHKKTCGNDSHEKEAKPIHASAADLLHIRIGSLD